MSTPLVIDEWLIADLNNENGPLNLEKSLNFIIRIHTVCDHFVMLKDSAIHKKINRFSKWANRDILTKSSFQFFNGLISTNPKKLIFMNSTAVSALSPALNRITPDDDKYLLQLHLLVRGSMIITSDKRLIGKYTKFSVIKIYEKEKFINDYLANNGISKFYKH